MRTLLVLAGLLMMAGVISQDTFVNFGSCMIVLAVIGLLPWWARALNLLNN
jgi:hypothetical protein